MIYYWWTFSDSLIQSYDEWSVLSNVKKQNIFKCQKIKKKI